MPRGYYGHRRTRIGAEESMARGLERHFSEMADAARAYLAAQAHYMERRGFPDESAARAERDVALERLRALNVDPDVATIENIAVWESYARSLKAQNDQLDAAQKAAATPAATPKRPTIEMGPATVEPITPAPAPAPMPTPVALPVAPVPGPVERETWSSLQIGLAITIAVAGTLAVAGIASKMGDSAR